MSAAAKLMESSTPIDDLFSDRPPTASLTPETRDIVMSMLQDGEGAAEISRRLNLPLRSVNAIITRHRNEIAAKERAKRIADELAAPKPVRIVSDKADLYAIPLHETTRYTCVAPLGKNRNGEHMCCGKPKDDLKQAYCPEHRERFYIRMTAADALKRQAKRSRSEPEHTSRVRRPMA